MRTRLSTQIAASNLGMEAIVFNVGQEGWTLEFGEDTIMNGTTVEHIRDAAPVLGQYFDLLGVRTFPSLKNKEEDYSEQVLAQFIRYAGIPIISLESATLHPLQSLADLTTMTELAAAGKKPKVVLTWAPHVKALPQCVANSFAQWVNAWGKAEFVIAHPGGLELDPRFTKGAEVTTHQEAALKHADFVYVKNWSSYAEYGKLPEQNSSWIITPERLDATNKARVMHCLPVRRNLELSAAVLDGPQSVVTQQAGNRVWAAQAVLAEILKSL
jgi:N-succinyl-L-ornithine transcarbamylase